MPVHHTLFVLALFTFAFTEVHGVDHLALLRADARAFGVYGHALAAAVITLERLAVVASVGLAVITAVIALERLAVVTAVVTLERFTVIPAVVAVERLAVITAVVALEGFTLLAVV